MLRKSLRISGTKAQAVGFGLGDLPVVAVAVVVGMLVLSFGALVIGDVQDDQTANSAEANVSGKGLTTLLNISNLIPTAGTVIGAAIIIGILLTAFRFANR